DGGYADWYLGALQDYEYFHDAWEPVRPNREGDAAAISQYIAHYGGNIKLRDTHNLFWTSTNISATHAKAYDVRLGTPWTTGQKIYGARGLAFRNFEVKIGREELLVVPTYTLAAKNKKQCNMNFLKDLNNWIQKRKHGTSEI